MTGKRIGLVVGNNYPNSNKELKFAVADATKMKEILLDKNICYFDDVVLLTNKTSREVTIELEKLFKNTHQGDLVFIYFSGHGAKDYTNKLRLFLEDTNEELLLATSLSFDFINECRKNSQALMASVIVVLDCCYSAVAGVKNTDVIGELENYCSTGMVVLSSTGSTGSRTARENENLGHSFFTYYLIEGLEKGYADENNDGLISIDDLYDYASIKTKNSCQQSPQKKGIIEGKFFIAKNPKKIKEKEFVQKKDKLVKIFRKELPANIYEASMTVLIDSYEKLNNLTGTDREIRNSLEDLLKDKISVKTYIHTVECLLKTESTENSSAHIHSSIVRGKKEGNKQWKEDEQDKRIIEEQETLIRQEKEAEKLEESKRKALGEEDTRKRELETRQQEDLYRQKEETEQKQLEERKKRDTETLERIKIEEPFIYPHERINEIEQLESEFALIRDKQLVLSNFLHIATNDENYCVRWAAVNVLKSVFPHVSNKQQAWEDLIKRLVIDVHRKHGYNIVYALRSAFPHMPNKEQAWNDLQGLTINKDYDVRRSAARIIGSLFPQLPNEEQAWNSLHKLANDNEHWVRSDFLGALNSAFPHIIDKQQAWEDLHRLTKDEYRINEYYPVKESAALVLGSLFSQLPDKQQAWDDLCRLSKDKNSGVIYRAISSIRYAFPYLPDKEQAWNDLHIFTNDKDRFVRRNVAETIGAVFPHLPDKQRAWEDLYKLIHDEEYDVIGDAVTAIGVAFPHLPDKQKAWEELHKLTYDSECFGYIDYDLPSAIGVAFPHLPDKQQAWKDLCRLSTYDYEGRQQAIEVLGSAFIYMPFKQHAIDDLYKLTKYGGEEEGDVRAYAYHSLGNVFIFKASKCTDLGDYKKELDTAIDFFEKARNQDCYENPSLLYLYLFRTLHTMLFDKQGTKEDLDKYLRYTKSNIGYGEYKEFLVEAVEDLATAFKQVQYLEDKDFITVENELKFYRKYLDHAEELIRKAAEDLPFITEAIRKGMYILDKNIKKILSSHLEMS